MADEVPKPKNFNVSIMGITPSTNGVNFNIQVTAPDVVSAVRSAEKELLKLLENAGLSVSPQASSPAPTPAA